MFLNSHGIRSLHHHAGLEHEERRRIEKKFLANEIDVLVATATLEMGLNLPVRQVVLYDVQMFDGAEFRPLSTNSVWQRVGRAGRPGLDERAEAVLIVPAWERGFENYKRGEFEPIISALTHPHALSEQIIAEVSSQMSRTRRQITHAFSQSLAAKQRQLPDVELILRQMLNSGMLREAEADKNKDKFILQTTRLGRIASRHFLSPETVLLFKSALTRVEELTFFDLLLICTSASDIQPVLPCDYEELEELSVRIADSPSILLGFSRKKIVQLLNVDGKRLLASIKMALAARKWCRSGEKELVAEKYNCYAFEVSRLRESLIRLLTAMKATVENPVEEQIEEEFSPGYAEKIRLLLMMVDGGLDEYAVTMTMLKGIGPKIANNLKNAGINDLLELAKADASKIGKISGVSQKRLKLWVREAIELSRSFSASDLFEISEGKKQKAKTGHKFIIDPYRLRRTLELTVIGSDGGNFFVSGGTEPHIIRTASDGLRCDCADFIQRGKGSYCKHILAVGLARGDSRILEAVKELKKNSDKKQIDLFDLWISGQKNFAVGRKTI